MLHSRSFIGVRMVHVQVCFSEIQIVEPDAVNRGRKTNVVTGKPFPIGMRLNTKKSEAIQSAIENQPRTPLLIGNCAV